MILALLFSTSFFTSFSFLNGFLLSYFIFHDRLLLRFQQDSQLEVLRLQQQQQQQQQQANLKQHHHQQLGQQQQAEQQVLCSYKVHRVSHCFARLPQ